MRMRVISLLGKGSVCMNQNAIITKEDDSDIAFPLMSTQCTAIIIISSSRSMCMRVILLFGKGSVCMNQNAMSSYYT